jgi:parvulin-like peptidyl-prolyl isomerase
VRKAIGTRTLVGLAVAAMLSVGLASCTSTVGYGVIVNGAVISATSINQDLSDIGANKQYVQQVNTEGAPAVVGTTPGSYNKAFVATVVQQLVQSQIIHQVVADAKVVPTAAQTATAKTEIAQELISQADPNGTLTDFPVRYQKLLIAQQADTDAFVNVETSTMSPADFMSYYQSHLVAYANEWCVRYIVIADMTSGGQPDLASSLADANRIKGLIDAGGDFAALAKEFSADNQGADGGSAGQGGKLTGSAPDGCYNSTDLSGIQNTPFVDAVESLPANVVSSPVSLQGGYALVEVTSRVIEPLDSTVTMDIRETLAGKKYIQLATTAKVKVNPEFGSFDNKTAANGQVIGVIPPVVPDLGATTTVPASAGAGSASGG